MNEVLLSIPIEKARLLAVLEDDIEAIVTARIAPWRAARLASLRRSRDRDGTLANAIQKVARASARVDTAHNTRDERPSINALIAAASGLRRAVRASEKG